MNIRYLSYPLSNDGAPHQSMAALTLSLMGCKVSFYGWGNEIKPTWVSDFDNLNYKTFPKRGFLSAINFTINIILSTLRNSNDLIYIQGAQQTPFVLWLLFFRKIKVIYHTQDYLGPGKSIFYEFCEKQIARRANHVILNEINRARFMQSSYRLKSRPEVIRTALPEWWKIDLGNSCRVKLLDKVILESERSPRIIVAGGRFDSNRMSEKLLEGFSKSPKNYVLVFTGMAKGSDEHTECLEKLKVLEISNRVIILESLTYHNLLNLYSSADIGILLYPNSGIGDYYQAPGRLTEYMRCGLPMVASNFPGFELLFTKYKLGYLADPYSDISIVEAIKKIGELNDAELLSFKEDIITLANNDFIYEKDAVPVFNKIAIKNDVSV